MARKSRLLTDHEEIRNWAEERDAQPSCVRGTGSEEDIGMIRLDFPGYSGESSLEPIEWDEWFQKFDENNLALLVEEQTAQGEQSNFNKIIGRETAAGAQGRKTSRHAASSERGGGTRGSSRKRPAHAGAKSKRSRSAAVRGTASRSARSRSKRSTSARGESSHSSRSSSRSSRNITPKNNKNKKKRTAQSARGNSRSRSRRRAA